MRFCLHYRGPLKANGKPEHKQALRDHFCLQLATLWAQKPLSEQEWLDPAAGDYCALRSLGECQFAPLITSAMDLVAELDVHLLRPERPGGLLTQGGDIDNRMKTLFDALTMPRHANSLPKGWAPGTQPVFCLLEDDNLVTSVRVHTAQLLEPTGDPNLVDLTVSVRVGRTRSTWGNGAMVL